MGKERNSSPSNPSSSRTCCRPGSGRLWLRDCRGFAQPELVSGFPRVSRLLLWLGCCRPPSRRSAWRSRGFRRQARSCLDPNLRSMRGSAGGRRLPLSTSNTQLQHLQPLGQSFRSQSTALQLSRGQSHEGKGRRREQFGNLHWRDHGDDLRRGSEDCQLRRAHSPQRASKSARTPPAPGSRFPRWRFAVPGQPELNLAALYVRSRATARTWHGGDRAWEHPLLCHAPAFLQRGALSDSGGEHKWLGSPIQGWNRPLSDLMLPQALPQGVFWPILRSPKNAKTRLISGFRPIAGAGFEPATFGL
jgi:hypothetical protein